MSVKPCSFCPSYVLHGPLCGCVKTCWYAPGIRSGCGALRRESVRAASGLRATQVPGSGRWRRLQRNVLMMIKELVDRRAFSWTDLFARLEERLPDGARLVSITPSVARGEICLDVQAVVRSPEVGWQFMRALEEDGDFDDVFPLSEGEGGEFHYTMRYRPRAAPPPRRRRRPRLPAAEEATAGRRGAGGRRRGLAARAGGPAVRRRWRERLKVPAARPGGAERRASTSPTRCRARCRSGARRRGRRCCADEMERDRRVAAGLRDRADAMKTNRDDLDRFYARLGPKGTLAQVRAEITTLARDLGLQVGGLSYNPEDGQGGRGRGPAPDEDERHGHVSRAGRFPGSPREVELFRDRGPDPDRQARHQGGEAASTSRCPPSIALPPESAAEEAAVRAERGFTYFELLATMVILMILASAILPTAKVRAQAAEGDRAAARAAHRCAPPSTSTSTPSTRARSEARTSSWAARAIRPTWRCWSRA